MTKVESFYRSVMSYRPESDIKLLRFALSGGYLIDQKKMYNQTYFSIQSKPKEVNMVPKQR